MRALRRSPVLLVLLVAALGYASLGATCNNAPKHRASLSLNAFAKALAGVQQAELTLYNAGKIPVTTHEAVKAKILKIATTADGAQTALDAWVPGQPVPVVVASMMQATRTLMGELVTLIPATEETQKTIAAVYDAIADLLLLMAG